MPVIRKTRRIFQVAIAIWHYAIAPFLWFGPRTPGPVRLRSALEHLGGTWIKLGQAVALRFDLLPDAYCYELFKLLNEVRPFSYNHVRQTIKEELGKWPEEIFASFATEPFASASIGQVHLAELHSGRKVAVKVQRPNIRRVIATDIELMYLLARVSDRLNLFKGTRSVEFVDEFASWTWEELDYREEAKHASELAKNALNDPLEKNAKVFSRYSSKRVLTTELLEGIPLIDVLYALRDGDDTYLNEIESQGHSFKRVARNILWNAMNQIYQFGFFHADLHPANLFILPDDAIGYVDFGIVGRISSQMRESLAAYSRNLFEGNVDRAVAEFMRWLTPSENTNVAAAREELTRAMRDYSLAIQSAQHKAAADSATTLQMEVLRILRRHHLSLSPSTTAYVKAVMTSTTVIYTLDPKFDFTHIENRFHRRLVNREVVQLLRPKRAIQFLHDYSLRVNRLFDVVDSFQSTEAFFREEATRVRRRLQIFAVLTAIAGLGLYFVVTRPRLAGKVMGQEWLSWLPFILVGALVLLVAAIYREGRKLPARRTTVPRSSSLSTRFMQRPRSN